MINLEELSLEAKVGQMLMFAFHGTDYNEQISTFISSFNLGGVVYFARNINELDKVATLNKKIQKESKIPFFIGLDQEGGSVLRIINGITPLPGAMALASADADSIYHITKAVGGDLKRLGFNLNFAPVGDVNNNPLNPVINSRSYSDNPDMVAKCASLAFQGFQDSKILPTIKHFPGHGNTTVDSHLGLPVVKNSLAEIYETELVPFIKAIEAGIDGVMISHILYEAFDELLPASLSHNIITKLLKEKLGFKGLICTDSLTMGAIYSRYSIEEILMNGVNAGNDILIFCGKADLDEQALIYEIFISLVKEGKISLSRIDESVSKILKLKQKYCKSNIDLTKLNNLNAYNLSKALQENSITKVKDLRLLPINENEKVLLIFPEIKLFSLVDNENQTYKTLNEYLNIEEIIINPEFVDFEMISRISSKYDKIIMASYNVKANDYQQQVFDLLDKDKVILVSLRSPYDILLMQGVQTYICIYEATKEAFSALELALYGKMPFKGKLPVEL